MPTDPVTPAPTPARPYATLAWIVWIGALLEAALIGFAPLIFSQLFATSADAENVELAVFLATLAFVVMAFATAGLLVSRQQPRNVVGWLMLAGGPALGAVFVGFIVGVSLLETDADGGSWFVLLGGVLFGPALYVLGPALASVFPAGRALPGWWSVAVWLSALGVVAGAAMTAFAPGQLEEGIAATNPLGIEALPGGLRSAANALTGVALVAAAVVAVASLVVRYVRSPSETRQQLKWFLFAGIVWTVVLPIGLVIGETWSAVVTLVALALVPAAVVVAVLRYRLYEIDTLINRTLVYIPLVGIVGGLYAGMVALLQRVFTAATGDTSDAAAVISALALAAVFTPIRNALQSAVDRRFKPDAASKVSQWDDPEFRAAVEAIVREMSARPR